MTTEKLLGSVYLNYENVNAVSINEAIRLNYFVELIDAIELIQTTIDKERLRSINTDSIINLENLFDWDKLRDLEDFIIAGEMLKLSIEERKTNPLPFSEFVVGVLAPILLGVASSQLYDISRPQIRKIKPKLKTSLAKIFKKFQVDTEKLAKWLEERANWDMGWGYKKGLQSRIDTTSLAVIALTNLYSSPALSQNPVIFKFLPTISA